MALERALSNNSQSSVGVKSESGPAATRQSSDDSNSPSASDSNSASQAPVVAVAETEVRRCSRALLEHILSLCYWRAVDDPEALNRHYKAFTSQTYGETSFEYVELVLSRVEFGADDIFIDLGSGALLSHLIALPISSHLFTRPFRLHLHTAADPEQSSSSPLLPLSSLKAARLRCLCFASLRYRLVFSTSLVYVSLLASRARQTLLSFPYY